MSQRIRDFLKTLASITVNSGVRIKVNLIYCIGFNSNDFSTFELLSWAKKTVQALEKIYVYYYTFSTQVYHIIPDGNCA